MLRPSLRRSRRDRDRDGSPRSSRTARQPRQARSGSSTSVQPVAPAVVRTAPARRSNSQAGSVGRRVAEPTNNNKFAAAALRREQQEVADRRDLNETAHADRRKAASVAALKNNDARDDSSRSERASNLKCRPTNSRRRASGGSSRDFIPWNKNC